MRRREMARALRLAVTVSALLATPGCAMLVRSVTSDLADHMTAAILDHDDPATVRDGIPSFLLLLDGMIQADPASTDLLVAAARLYGTYASTFAEEPERGVRLAVRARAYGGRAMCLRSDAVCAQLDAPFDAFAATLATTTRRDVPALYALGTAWATWISLNSDDWKAVAELPHVEAVMARVVELDETFDDGAAHLYLGVLKSQRPAALGGKPEEAREHFERALALSSDRNLMVKVLLARHYARLVFDRELHDRLLKEVIGADARSEGFTLSNMLAQGEARALLADADEYF